MFNHNTLERDIERLSRDIAEKRSQPEYKDYSEKEIVREVIRPIIKEALSSRPASPAQTDDGDDSGMPLYLKDSPEEIKLEVEKLVDSVFHNGLVKTLVQARKTNPFVLDAFHDALADKLYEELQKRKLI